MALNVYFKGMWHIWGRGVLVRKPEGKRPIGDRGIDGRIILKLAAINSMVGSVLALFGSG